MANERNLSALLPPMPPPRPDTREAAIGEAMRRFDGEVPASKPARSQWRKSLLGRPQLGALAVAALVATVGLPLWLSGDLTPHIPAGTQSEPVPVPAEAPAAAPVLADMTAPSSAEARPEPKSPPSPIVAAPARPSANVGEDAEASMEAVPPPPVMAAPAPVAAPAPPPPPPAAEPVPSEAANDVVVTGARVSRPAAAKVRSEQRRAAMFAEQALGATARADRSMTDAPVSATDWLNRGLAQARAGDDKRALEDLDRAVKLAPEDANFRYQRSLILRRLGKIARADADAAKATELDPRYKTGN